MESVYRKLTNKRSADLWHLQVYAQEGTALPFALDEGLIILARLVLPYTSSREPGTAA